MVIGKPLLPPPAAKTPITTATKEQKEDDNDKDEIHNFLRENKSLILHLIFMYRIIIHQPRNLLTGANPVHRAGALSKQTGLIRKKGGSYPSRMKNPFRYFNSSPEMIYLTVMLYIRYPLSLRQVEDLLFECRFGSAMRLATYQGVARSSEYN